LQADETCSITVRDALLLNNTSAYGGAIALQGSAHLLVEAGAVFRDNYGEYGGCVAAQVGGASSPCIVCNVMHVLETVGIS
jgi:predicted outer membrane repeat protein